MADSQLFLLPRMFLLLLRTGMYILYYNIHIEIKIYAGFQYVTNGIFAMLLVEIWHIP